MKILNSLILIAIGIILGGGFIYFFVPAEIEFVYKDPIVRFTETPKPVVKENNGSLAESVNKLFRKEIYDQSVEILELETEVSRLTTELIGFNKRGCY